MKANNTPSGDARASLVNRNQEMALFDMLPPAVREALRNAAYDFSCTQTAEAVIAGAPPRGIVALLQLEDLAVARENGRAHLLSRDAISGASLKTRGDVIEFLAGLEMYGIRVETSEALAIVRAISGSK